MMKEFNLDEALQGKPVKLRNGWKAIVYYRIPDEFVNSEGDNVAYPLKGITFQADGAVLNSINSWKDDGCFSAGKRDFDIVGMWEEPKISVEDLPKPFNPKDGDKYFYFSENGVERVTFCEADDSDTGLAENGQCFRTREDAQKWLDFMKSIME